MMTSLRSMCAGILGVFLAGLPASAGVVRFNATINAAQETNGSTSTATGTAVMFYDVTSNRFDLTVTLTGFTEPLTDSHIHEAAIGVSGSVVEPFGAEVNYTRNGNTITGTFTNVQYSGAPGTLISGGAYLNYHTAAWPAGEIRGQLLPEPVHLTAAMTAAQEVRTPPVVSSAYGAAQAIYNPLTNRITTLVCVYNFTNTLTLSHIHEAPVGVNGGIRVDFGGAAAYTNSGTSYVQLFSEQTYGGTPALLLSEGAYVNVHSNIYGGGEIRGQLSVLDPSNPGRLANVSARGPVGTADNVLITGLSVSGGNPVRVLITARGPVLSGFGVTGVLADPRVSIFDGAGRALFTNDNQATAPFQALITGSGFAPTLAAESAVLLVLPPGTYTAVVSGVGGTTGNALAEAFEVAW